MTDELWILFAAVVLGIVHVSVDSFTFKAQAGNQYTVGPRDEQRERAGVAGRVHRAARNYTENFALFAAIILMLHVSGESSRLSLYGAYTWIAARSLYLIAYASGIPWTRTICWQAAMIGLIMMMVALF